MAELKPCEVCGNDEVYLDKRFTNDGTEVYVVTCDLYYCNRLSERFYTTPEEAIKAWNEKDYKEG